MNLSPRPKQSRPKGVKEYAGTPEQQEYEALDKELKEIQKQQNIYENQIKQVGSLLHQGKLQEAEEAENKVYAEEDELQKQLDDFSTNKVARFVRAAVENANRHEHAAVTNGLALSLIALLAGLGIALFVSRDISRGMKSSVELANSVAAGDLSRQLQIDQKDEIGQLAIALNKMTGNLSKTAMIADKISMGDLSADVKLLSERDTLGIALDKMLAGLRDRAVLAEQISQGNLQTEVKILSREDGLGVSLDKMVNGLRDRATLAERISQGNLQVTVKILSEKDGLGLALDKMVNGLRDRARLADQIAKGDLTVTVKILSPEDELGISLEKMVENLRKVVNEVASATNNVASGSQQLSATAQQLSQGATEQSASAEECTASMEENVLEHTAKRR